MDADFAATLSRREFERAFALNQWTSLTVFYMQPLDDHEPGKKNRLILILGILPRVFYLHNKHSQHTSPL
jgi:hypothetical protein